MALYRPCDEHDACGTGFVADVSGTPSRTIVAAAVEALAALSHRGALGTDGRSSDGAGLLTTLPKAILHDWMIGEGIDAPNQFAVAVFFVPPDDQGTMRELDVALAVLAEAGGFEVCGWRRVPVEPDCLGPAARSTAPDVWHAIISVPDELSEGQTRRGLFLLRRRLEHRLRQRGRGGITIASLSHRTIVYKGLMLARDLATFYPDLADPRFEAAVAVFHQRYSTNTFPAWQLAQPLRYLAHNGEINTVVGNTNWMRARTPELAESSWADDLDVLNPIIARGASDSLALDNVLELLTTHTGSLTASLAMMIPMAHEPADSDISEALRAFYRCSTSMMEPWDGPAAVVATDGRRAMACLDRNGLRPLRYTVTDRGLIVVASESGVVQSAGRVIESGRLGPGEMLVVDLEAGGVFRDAHVKEWLAGRRDWVTWVDEHIVDAPVAEPPPFIEDNEELARHQKTFGWGKEHIGQVLEPMMYEGREPLGSMGDDTPLAVLSERPQRLYAFFQQRFAQVTNPPIDPYRERRVMSLITRIGPGEALFANERRNGPLVRFTSPILSPAGFAGLAEIEELPSTTLSTTFSLDSGPEGLEPAVEELCARAVAAVRDGARLLVLSDREVSASTIPIPMLLAISAVHHALIYEGLRMDAGVVCDTASAIEDHDIACLVGYGADLVFPWLAMSAVAQLVDKDPRKENISLHEGLENFRSALDTGLLKIMSKLGISVVNSYRGAQTFECLGLSKSVVDRWFGGTPSRLGGIGLDAVATSAIQFHHEAWGAERPVLRERGIYRYRRNGEYHAFNPMVFKALHKAVRDSDKDAWEEYTRQVDDGVPCHLRDLLVWQSDREPIALSLVEPADSIVARFCTGAMSFGSLSRETHEVLAVAMNRLGGKSNSGEGGEDRTRFTPFTEADATRSVAPWKPGPGDSANSAIKQVASGRFGVTPEYLVSARELEIKMAQGAKPGEGGQIPSHKVTEEIAAVRRATPGTTLISPPPHHDIYSIEDLAQLIYDLKRVNDRARVCVKLVAAGGIGTIAAGVAKGWADTVQISGHEGGTGASPLSSIKHAGMPWELGLSEVHEVLLANGLRDRVTLRVDGGLKTGRDVVLAALMGAEEFGFGTVSLLAVGCVMARQCHRNTCPVGVATQRDDLRARFPGTPDQLVAYMYFVAEHVRLILAELGVRSLDELIGRRDMLTRRPGLPRAFDGLQLDELLDPLREQWQPRRADYHPLGGDSLDARIVGEALGALSATGRAKLEYSCTNEDRSLGAGLSGALARRRLEQSNGEGPITIRFVGTAGQSFGAFVESNISLVLEGDAQDYVAKGLAGGHITIKPGPDEVSDCWDVARVGNTVLYGATEGALLVAGRAGERFCVRNSGADAVVEGCGDHGCEYMTGGTAVFLGPIGHNFGAGMTGGEAFVFDPLGDVPNRYLATASVVAEKPDDDALQRVRALVGEHHHATGSPLSKAILDEWPLTQTFFWRVIAA